MMELKVWVDGIKRVVCGVTDHTTCQDIVIALAQAMGRTGRFTLIEQWRENERPLAPEECPLLVLQKWGEFANEVKLILYESGTRRKHKLAENDKTVKKPQDRFTHNFTPPVKTSEAIVRRSLTFSGARKPESNSLRRDEHLNPVYGQHILPNKMTAPPSHKLQNEGLSSSSSLSSQNPSAIPQQRHQVRSSSQDRLLSHDQRRRSPQPPYVQHSDHRGSPQHPTNHRSSPQHATNHISSPQHQTNHRSSPQHPTNHRSSPQHPTNQNHPPPYSANHNHAPHQFPTNQNHVPKTSIPHSNHNHIHNQRPPPYTQVDKRSQSVPVVNGPIRSSAFSPVLPRRNSTEDERDVLRIPNTDIPVYTQTRKSSHKTEVEEYDLDSNFPDVVKETGHEFLVEEYHVPGGKGEDHGHHGNRLSWEEQERVKLLRLVTMQNERIKMQDSQLDIIDTEIGSREQKLEDLKLELNTVLEQLTELTEQDKAQTDEIVQLDNSNLIEEIEKEKQVEKDIKSELNSLHARLEKCETDLHQFKTKVKLCSEDLEKETEMQKIDEKRRKEEEVKIQNEIQELKKNIEERSKELKDKTKNAEQVQNELYTVTDQLEDKTNDLTAVETDLQKENLKFFQEPQTTETSSKMHESNGEAVIKVLEGGVSPNLKRKMANNPLTILSVTKNKNGVWV